VASLPLLHAEMTERIAEKLALRTYSVRHSKKSNSYSTTSPRSTSRPGHVGVEHDPLARARSGAWCLRCSSFRC